jgi:hypothetical protein
LTGQVQKIVQDVSFSVDAFNSLTSAADFLAQYKVTVQNVTGAASSKVKVVIDTVNVLVEVTFKGTIENTQENRDKLAIPFATRAGVSVDDVTIEFLTRRLRAELARRLQATTRVKATFVVQATNSDSDRITRAKGIKTLLSDTDALTSAVSSNFTGVTASSVSVTYKVTVKTEVQTSQGIDTSALDTKISNDLGCTAQTTSHDAQTTTHDRSVEQFQNGSPRNSGYIFTAFMLVLAVITKTLG